MDPKLFEIQIKRVLESFRAQFGINDHHTQSFEYFINESLGSILHEQFPISVYVAKHQILHRVFLNDFYFKKPTVIEPNGFLKELTPVEAHLHKQTYSFDVFVNVTHKIYKGTPENFKLFDIRNFVNLPLCKIPCMLGSSACHTHKNFDIPSRDSGIFIINGYEKVIITNEHLKPNFPYVFHSKGKYLYDCEIRSFHASGTQLSLIWRWEVFFLGRGWGKNLLF